MRLRGLLILLAIAFLVFGCQPQGDEKKADDIEAVPPGGAGAAAKNKGVG